MNEVKCLWQSQCSYYEQTTNYGTEVLKCKNTDCPLFEIEAERMTNQEQYELICEKAKKYDRLVEILNKIMEEMESNNINGILQIIEKYREDAAK